MAHPCSLDQGAGSHQALRTYPNWPLIAAGALPSVPGSTGPFGPSGTTNSRSEQSSSDTSDCNNKYSGQRLAGTKRSYPGHAGNSNSTSVLDAPLHRKPPAVQYGHSDNFGTTSRPIAAASTSESKALVDKSTASQPQPFCSNRGTHQCPANTWRNGPAGPRSLCNGCGLRYKRYGADRFIPGSAAAVAAVPELAAQAVVELPVQHRLARTNSTCNNLVGKPETAARREHNTAAPAAALTTKMTSSNLGAAASAAQRRPSKRLKFSTAKESIELSSTRQVQRQKRPRDASGDADGLLSGIVTRSRKLAATAAPLAASGGVLQPAELAAPAVSGLGADLQSHTDLAAPEPDMRAEAFRVLSMVAPGAPTVGVRKSRRVAARKARQLEALKASQAAAQEDEEAAQVLQDMANFGWVDNLFDVLGEAVNAV